MSVVIEMSSEPVYSVVVSTYNRAATLRGAIASLLALEPAPVAHEIVIVNNNSTDDTRAVVEALIPESGGRLRYLFEGKQGASHGRNAGAAAARGEILVFTDDDVRATPRWLRAVHDVFTARPEMTYVGGPVRPIWPSAPPAWLTDWFWSPLAVLDYGASGLELGRVPFYCLVAANFMVRKAAFDAVGGFDPRYQHAPGAVSASEDHELQIRLLDAGYCGWYDPGVEMHAEVQPDRLTLRYHRKWAYDHGRALVRMTPPGAIFDEHTRFLPEPADARHLLGVPLWMYREQLRQLKRYIRHLGPGKRQHRLWTEFKMLHHLGMAQELAATRHARRRARGDASFGRAQRAVS